MPEFMCRIATSAGEVFERSYVSDDEAALRRDLESQDLMVHFLRTGELIDACPAPCTHDGRPD